MHRVRVHAQKGMQLEPKKSFFCATQVEYLGFIIKCKGLKPQLSKVDTIINIVLPKTVTQLQGFIGLVIFYRDLWKKWAHYLELLVDLITKRKGSVEWTDKGKQVFEKMKESSAQDALLHYPEFGRPFNIHTDLS